MASISESAQAAGAGKAAVLQAGVDQISERQPFTFTLYTRLVLPADGYVFWCLASAVNPIPDPTPEQLETQQFQAKGSLHLTQSIEQEPESTIARQRVVFTSESEIRQFEAVAPGDLFLLNMPNGSLAAFSSQTMRYDTSGLWHYQGVAVLPYEASQIIDDPADVLEDDTIVSNSLPFWLAMSTLELPIYPADLSPMNLVPPYITADIDNTTGLQATALVALDSSQQQLCSETVTFTLWGCRNAQALDFQKALNDNSFANGYGVMNIPVPVDLKKPQAEFGIIAQQKRMMLDVNYYQQGARDVARKLILSAFITVNPEG